MLYVLIPSIGNGLAAEAGSPRTFETNARVGKALESAGQGGKPPIPVCLASEGSNGYY
jgi:hypothetical protein